MTEVLNRPYLLELRALMILLQAQLQEVLTITHAVGGGEP